MKFSQFLIHAVRLEGVRRFVLYTNAEGHECVSDDFNVDDQFFALNSFFFSFFLKGIERLKP